MAQCIPIDRPIRHWYYMICISMYCTTACYMYKVKIKKNLAAIINFVISVIPNKKLQSRLLIKPITHLLLQFLSNNNGPQSVSPFQLKINTKNTHLNNIQIPPKSNNASPSTPSPRTPNIDSKSHLRISLQSSGRRDRWSYIALLEPRGYQSPSRRRCPLTRHHQPCVCRRRCQRGV